MTHITSILGVEPIQRALENDSHFEDVVGAPNFAPFAPNVVEFVSNLAMSILSSPDAKRYPQLVALGFWLRRANLNRMMDRSKVRDDCGFIRLPRGLVFHVAPSNVDTIFVYSWILSLLCGNRNIVRLPTQVTEQLSVLLKIIDQVLSLESSSDIRRTLSMLRYAVPSDATAHLSALCDTRVIWGGDSTVGSIRKTAIPPTAIDICFANKWSMSVIDCGFWLSLSDESKINLARKFALDAFQFGQAACSSPRCLLWLNATQMPFSSDEFWRYVRTHVRDIFQSSDIDMVNKLVTTDLWAAAGHGAVVPGNDNVITRVEFDVKSLPTFVNQLDSCDGGLFLESQVRSLTGVFSGVGRKLQTVSTAGLNSEFWFDLIKRENIGCIDRIVPIGSGLDFDVNWDGFNLFESFMRRIAISV